MFCTVNFVNLYFVMFSLIKWIKTDQCLLLTTLISNNVLSSQEFPYPATRGELNKSNILLFIKPYIIKVWDDLISFMPESIKILCTLFLIIFVALRNVRYSCYFHIHLEYLFPCSRYICGIGLKIRWVLIWNLYVMIGFILWFLMFIASSCPQTLVSFMLI